MLPSLFLWLFLGFCPGVLTFVTPPVHSAPFLVEESTLFLARHHDSTLNLKKIPTRLRVSFSTDDEDDLTLEAIVKEEKWVDKSKFVEAVGLSVWMASISAFILINNFMGPWPSFMGDVPERVWFLFHMLGGMFFGGGVLLTTAIEYMVATNSNTSVLQFWFDKVPLLDMAIVLPGLTLAMISGTGLAIEHYGGLGLAPAHIQYVFWALLVFATWWGLTDLTTQGSALKAVQEHVAASQLSEGESEKAPDVVLKRTLSNVVSCLLVFLVYSIMVLKPGTIHYW